MNTDPSGTGASEKCTFLRFPRGDRTVLAGCSGGWSGPSVEWSQLESLNSFRVSLHQNFTGTRTGLRGSQNLSLQRRFIVAFSLWPPPRKAPTPARRPGTARGSEISPKRGSGRPLGNGGTQVGRRCTSPPSRAAANLSRCCSLPVPEPQTFSTPFSHTLGHSFAEGCSHQRFHCTGSGLILN